MPASTQKRIQRLALILSILGLLAALVLFILGEFIDAGFLLGAALLLFGVWGYFRVTSKGGAG